MAAMLGLRAFVHIRTTFLSKKGSVKNSMQSVIVKNRRAQLAWIVGSFQPSVLVDLRRFV